MKKRYRKILIEQLIPILAMMGSSFFFVITAILGFDYSGIGSSNTLLIYSLIILVATAVLFGKSFIWNGAKITQKDLFLLLVMVVVLLSYLTSSLFSGRLNPTATTFFLQFLAFSLPAILGALYLSRMQTIFEMAKLLELVMLLVTLSIFVRLIIPAFRGVRLLTFGGAYFGQIGSYLSAFAFGLNLYFLFEGSYHDRFALFRSMYYKLLCIYLLFIQIIGFIITGGRGGAVLGAIYLLYMLLTRLSLRKLKYLLTTIGFLSFLVITLIAIWPLLMQISAFQYGLFRVTQFIGSGGGINWAGTSGRDIVYRSALELIKQRPILGYGIFGMWDFSYYPHNLFLEVLLQGGVIYLVIMLIVLFLFAWKVTHLISKDRRYKLLVVLFMYPFVMLMFSGTYLSTPQFWFVLVFVLVSRQGAGKSMNTMRKVGISQ
ncbi:MULTISPECIES: O-antigen ligase [unclassified Mesotoga]|uniref:O-antigen ligase family protein n=1 Tax=unclassified Mesotoga TaxID=1184398 RepID=UPI0011B399C9|nr:MULTISPECIES: O-antigen ligase family protein [unclassified Mesotoga]